MTGSLQTRLVDRALWYRHCGWFTFAHKPLCGHYRQGVLRLGNVAVCRSCSLVYLSLGLTLLLGYWLGLWALPHMDIALAGLTVMTAAVSYPPSYKKLPRIACDIARSALGVVIGVTALLVFFAPLAPLPILNTAILVAIWFIFGAKRQQTKRGKCATCPEFREGHVCSGYAAQVESVRNYQDALAAHLTRTQTRF